VEERELVSEGILETSALHLLLRSMQACVLSWNGRERKSYLVSWCILACIVYKTNEAVWLRVSLKAVVEQRFLSTEYLWSLKARLASIAFLLHRLQTRGHSASVMRDLWLISCQHILAGRVGEDCIAPYEQFVVISTTINQQSKIAWDALITLSRSSRLMHTVVKWHTVAYGMGEPEWAVDAEETVQEQDGKRTV